MLAALALLAVQAMPATEPPGIPQGGVPRPPDDAQTFGASVAIVQCVIMRDRYPHHDAYIAAIPDLRRRIAADPRLAGVTLDDDGGRGCRVTFTGTPGDADLMQRRAAHTPNQLVFARAPAPGGGERISTTVIAPR